MKQSDVVSGAREWFSLFYSGSVCPPGSVWRVKRRRVLTFVSPREDRAQADLLVLLFGSHWEWFGGVIQQRRVSGTTVHSQGGGWWFLFNIDTIGHL